jgi:hypothetical protein
MLPCFIMLLLPLHLVDNLVLPILCEGFSSNRFPSGNVSWSADCIGYIDFSSRWMPSIHVSLSAIINVGNVCRCLSGPDCRGLGLQHHLEYRSFSQVCSLVALGAMHPAVGVRCLSLIVGHGWAVGQVALGQCTQWSACKCLRACGAQAIPVAPDGVPISV